MPYLKPPFLNLSSCFLSLEKTLPIFKTFKKLQNQKQLMLKQVKEVSLLVLNPWQLDGKSVWNHCVMLHCVSMNCSDQWLNFNLVVRKILPGTGIKLRTNEWKDFTAPLCNVSSTMIHSSLRSAWSCTVKRQNLSVTGFESKTMVYKSHWLWTQDLWISRLNSTHAFRRQTQCDHS